MAIVLNGLVLARIHRVSSCVSICLSLVICLLTAALVLKFILLVAGSFLKGFTLLIIHLAVSVAWHDRTLLT